MAESNPPEAPLPIISKRIKNMKFETLEDKLLKKDPILRIFKYCFEYDKNADFKRVNPNKLEKCLKKLVKQGKLLN